MEGTIKSYDRTSKLLFVSSGGGLFTVPMNVENIIPPHAYVDIESAGTATIDEPVLPDASLDVPQTDEGSVGADIPVGDKGEPATETHPPGDDKCNANQPQGN